MLKYAPQVVEDCVKGELQLMTKDKDSGWVRRESSVVDYYSTPVAHYWRFDRLDRNYQSWLPEGFSDHFFRVYEQYFDTIVDVRDSFAVVYITGISLDCRGIDPVILVGKSDSTRNLIPPVLWLDERHRNEWAYSYIDRYVMIFPLLSPDYHPPVQPDDTSSHTGIQTLADGVTTVLPNPAFESVRMVSSAGLSKVEVYDLAGRQVYAAATTGNSHNVDVTGWPVGSYVVKLYTPVGVATKQLLVQ